MSAPAFTAAGNAVFREPEIVRRSNREKTIALGFKVLTVEPFIKTDDDTSPAEEIARLMNLGALALEIVAMLKAARATFSVAYEADGTIMAISPGNEALRAMVLTIDAAIAKAEGGQ